MQSFFLGDLVLLLVVSITVVVLLRRLRLPPLAGFLVVGVALGPHALGWIRAVDEVEALAEIGVALLLFTVGLEFSIPRMLLLRRLLVLGGGGQIALTILVVWGLGLALGAYGFSGLLSLGLEYIDTFRIAQGILLLALALFACSGLRRTYDAA